MYIGVRMTRPPYEHPDVMHWNRLLKELITEAGLCWDPGNRTGVWVEKIDDKFYICDPNNTCPLSDNELNEESLTRITKEWIEVARN